MLAHLVPGKTTDSSPRWTTRLTTFALVAGLGLVDALPSKGQLPKRLADINTGTDAPLERPAMDFARLPSGAVVFAGQDDDHGLELWISDGTAGGTGLLRDINPGPASSTPKGFAIFQDQVFFAAQTFAHGLELWTSDGTAAGTKLLADIEPGSRGSDPMELVVSGDRLYFVAEDSANGLELRSLDDQGTLWTVDIVPGDVSARPQELVPSAAGGVYFRATTPASGPEPYYSAGTLATTRMIDELVAGSQGSTPTRFFELPDGRLAFQARLAGIGGELAIWDPEQELIHTFDLNSQDSSSPLHFVLVEDQLYFSAKTAGFGRELHRWDLSDLPPTMVADLAPGTFSGFAGPMVATPDGLLLFAGQTAESGIELVRSTGTEAGTELLDDLWPGPRSSSPRHFVLVDDELLFVALQPEGPAVYATDGEDVAALKVYDDANQVVLRAAGAAWASVYADSRREVVAFHSSSGSSEQVLEVRSSSSSPRRITPGRVPAEVLLEAADGRGREPWMASRNVAPRILGDLRAGPDSSDLEEIVATETHAFVAAWPRHDAWLWDGDNSQPVVLETGEDASPRSGARLGTKILYFADLDDDPELIALEPATGAWQGLGLPEGGGDSTILNAGEVALFAYGSPSRLWISDGSPEGTATASSEVRIVTSDSRWGAVLRPQNGSGSLRFVFAGWAGATGSEPFFSDGTEEGTVLLADLAPGTAGSSPEGFVAGPKGQVLFWASPLGLQTPRQLMVSNGLGVTKLTSFSSDDPDAAIVGVTDEGWFFKDSRGGTGRELWFTDGTPGGTHSLDLNPGPAWSLLEEASPPTAIATSRTHGYFFAYTPERGYELWRSDGSHGGTEPLAEILPGPAGQSAAWPTLWHQGVVYFAANGMDGSGLELWTLDVEGALFLDSFERGNTSSWSFSSP